MYHFTKLTLGFLPALFLFVRQLQLWATTPIWYNRPAPAQLPASAKHFAETSRRAELSSYGAGCYIFSKRVVVFLTQI
jgi:hypothetical protein